MFELTGKYRTVEKMNDMISEVFNEDCMVGMKRYPDKFFDLAIVDPPYAHNSGHAFTSRLKRYGQIQYNDVRPDSIYFNELFRVSKNQIVWGGNYFISDLYSTKCMIFWYKHQPVDTYADGEIAWTSFQDRHSALIDYKYFGAINREANRCHPNQKPVFLYKVILQDYAENGYKIIDTHLGSGSSRIAAYDMGFDFTGFEIDKDYYEAQEKRFKQHIAQLKMFVSQDS